MLNKSENFTQFYLRILSSEHKFLEDEIILLINSLIF